MTVPVQKLSEEPYASVICYPRCGKGELRRRLRELQRLQVETLEFDGEKHVSDVQVLGKGCVGIVVVAHRNGQRIALKIRRVDADRAGMEREAKMLQTANGVDVGPALLGVSRDFLLMQFISGLLIPHWLDGKHGKMVTRRVLRDVLEQCWRLDAVGLDHGELSHAPKHIIVGEGDKPVIVDFETASLVRRPSNVTSVCQFLFISGPVAEKVGGRSGIDREAIIRALRRYKKERTRGNFDFVLEACGLQTM